jgi:hypothetical protein
MTRLQSATTSRTNSREQRTLRLASAQPLLPASKPLTVYVVLYLCVAQHWPLAAAAAGVAHPPSSAAQQRNGRVAARARPRQHNDAQQVACGGVCVHATGAHLGHMQASTWHTARWIDSSQQRPQASAECAAATAARASVCMCARVQ